MHHNKFADKYGPSFYLSTALKACLDGLAVVPCTQISKKSYDGSYIVFYNNKFREIDVDGSDHNIINPNDLSAGWYELHRFNTAQVPKQVWYSNIGKGELKPLNFSSILLTENNIDAMGEYYNTGICIYEDAKYNQYTVKFRKYSRGCTLWVDTKGITLDKKESVARIRNWVLGILDHQEKLGKRKILKSLYRARKWLCDNPEMFT